MFAVILVGLFSVKSYAIVIAASVLGGGVLGFLYGGSVEKKAQAIGAKAASAVGGELKKL